MGGGLRGDLVAVLDGSGLFQGRWSGFEDSGERGREQVKASVRMAG